MAVDPQAIEAEFLSIWRDASASGYDQSSIRLRVLNFVAIGYRDDDEARFDKAMQLLPERHPCRAILAMGIALDRVTRGNRSAAKGGRS